MDMFETVSDDFTLPSHWEALEEWFSSSEYSMFLVDTIISIFERADISNQQEASKILLPLSKLAQQYKVTVLGINHFTKALGNNPLDRIYGAKAFTTHARSVLAVTEVAPHSASYLLGQIKSSYGRMADHSLGYTIKDVDGVGEPMLDELVNTNVTEAILAFDQSFTNSTKPKKTTSSDWLRNYLEVNGPTSSGEVRAAADKAGIQNSTFYNAKELLGVVSSPVPGSNKRMLSLPPSMFQFPTGGEGSQEEGTSVSPGQTNFPTSVADADRVGNTIQLSGRLRVYRGVRAPTCTLTRVPASSETSLDPVPPKEPMPTKKILIRRGVKVSVVPSREVLPAPRVTREDLERMEFRDLRAYAMNDLGVPKADLRGLTEDDTIATILNFLESEQERFDEDQDDEPTED